MKLNGTAKIVIPVAALVALVVSLHVLQQNEVCDVREASSKNTTDIARESGLRGAQFDEILRSLERIEKELE